MGGYLSGMRDPDHGGMSGLGPQRIMGAVTSVECEIRTMAGCMTIVRSGGMYDHGPQWILWAVTAAECVIRTLLKYLVLIMIVHVFSVDALNRFSESIHVFSMEA